VKTPSMREPQTSSRPVLLAFHLDLAAVHGELVVVARIS